MCFSVQVDRKLNRVAKRFQAEVDILAFERFLVNKEANPKYYKAPDEENRIYPNYFAPVITFENGKRILSPKKYQLLPHFSKENKYRAVNPKTNRKKEISTYNARLDSLEKRNAWEPLFMRKHCVFPFVRFFEWVEYQGNKRQIGLYPNNSEIMWAPGLHDKWTSEDGQEIIDSFALITTEPPKEVEEMGHDRCPVYLKEEYIDRWLQPNKETKDDIYSMLFDVEKTVYLNEWVS